MRKVPPSHLSARQHGGHPAAHDMWCGAAGAHPRINSIDESAPSTRAMQAVASAPPTARSLATEEQQPAGLTSVAYPARACRGNSYRVAASAASAGQPGTCHIVITGSLALTELANATHSPRWTARTLSIRPACMQQPASCMSVHVGGPAALAAAFHERVTRLVYHGGGSCHVCARVPGPSAESDADACGLLEWRREALAPPAVLRAVQRLTLSVRCCTSCRRGERTLGISPLQTCVAAVESVSRGITARLPPRPRCLRAPSAFVGRRAWALPSGTSARRRSFSPFELRA